MILERLTKYSQDSNSQGYEPGTLYRTTKGEFFFYDEENNKRIFYFLNDGILEEFKEEPSQVRVAFPAPIEDLEEEMTVQDIESRLKKIPLRKTNNYGFIFGGAL